MNEAGSEAKRDSDRQAPLTASLGAYDESVRAVLDEAAGEQVRFVGEGENVVVNGGAVL